MDDGRIQDAVAAYISKVARMGGIARAKRLTADQRKAIATKASKAAAVARRKKANARKKRGS